MEEPESDPGAAGRRLRRSTLSHQPGRYAEMLVAGVEKPAFTVPDPIFDPEPSRHCAFPTIELDEYPGPSEVFMEARARGELGGGSDSHRQSSFDGDGLRDEQNARPALVAHLPPYEDQAIDDDEEDDDAVTEENHQCSSPPRHPIRGESFKDFNLAVTQGLDWGSPEPESEHEPQLPGIYGFGQETIFHPEVEAPPDDWSRIETGVQWVIIATLCQAYPFSVAVQKLQLTTRQITAFVQTYIRCNEKIIEWCDKINRTPVADLIRSAEKGSMSVDYYVRLARPELPTDIIFLFQLEQARTFLRKIHHGELTQILGKWRGTSTSFVELPIHPDILDTCRSMLYRERPITLQDFRPIRERLPTPWLERLHEMTDYSNAVSHFRDYYTGPTAADPFENPFAPDPNIVNTTDAQNFTQPEAFWIDQSMGSTQANNEISSGPTTSQLDQNGRTESPASSRNAGQADSSQPGQQPGPELQITHNQASVHDPRTAKSLRKNPFKRPADNGKNGMDRPSLFPTSGDPLQPVKEIGHSQVASMMISRQQRKDTPRHSRKSQGPAKRGVPKMKFPGFAESFSSHGPKPFKDSASGLGSYTSLTANRGSGSYTSPYLFNTPPKEPVPSTQLEPRFELKISESAHNQHEAAPPSEEQGDLSANVPGGNGRGTEHSMDSFVNDDVTEVGNEGLPAQPQDSAPAQRSRKRAADDSEEEYREQDDDKDDDWVQPRKKSRKSNASDTSTRNSKKNGAAKSKATKNKKKAPEIGPDGQPIKRPRGRPRKHPRPEDVRNQPPSNAGLTAATTTDLESSSKKAALEKQNNNQPLMNDSSQMAESTGTEASGTRAPSMPESAVSTSKAHETQKKTPIKLKLLNSKSQASTARTPATSAKASYGRQPHSQLTGSAPPSWQSSNFSPRFGENLASTGGGFQMSTETRAPGEVRQNHNVSPIQASRCDPSRNTQCADYQEFWNDSDRNKECHEAAMHSLMSDIARQRRNTHHSGTTGIPNVQSTAQMPSAPTTAAGKKTQKPTTRAQRAAQISRISGPQVRRAPRQDGAQSWAETNMSGTAATTGPHPQSQQNLARAPVQLSGEALAQAPTHRWGETGVHEAPMATGFSLQSQQAPTQDFAQAPAEASAEVLTEAPAAAPAQDLAEDPASSWAKSGTLDNPVNAVPEAASLTNTVGWSEYESTPIQPPYVPGAIEQQTIDPNASLASDIGPELMARMLHLQEANAQED